MDKLLKLAKLSVGVCETSTIKDEEIKLCIRSGIEDLKRQGISADLNKSLIVQAIVMYVKANFGNVDLKEKENSAKIYNSLCNKLSLSEDYKEKNV